MTKLKTTKVTGDALRITSLTADCPRRTFSCSYEHIDHWFRTHALSCHEDLDVRVCTAHLGNDPSPVGFYALSMKAELLSDFDRSWFSRFKGGNLITLHLKWIAVRTDLQRQNVGTVLMGRVLSDFLFIADTAGADALTLTSISSMSTEFYRTLDFMEYGSASLGKKMFLPAAKVLRVRDVVNAELRANLEPMRLSASATTSSPSDEK